MNYDSPPVQYNLYTRITSHRLYETAIELAGYQIKEGCSKHQISVELDASRMKKINPTLPIRDTLMVRLQQLRNQRCKSAPTVHDRSKRVRKVYLPNECSARRNTELIYGPLRIRRNGPDKVVSTTEVPYCFQKSEHLYNPEPTIHL